MSTTIQLISNYFLTRDYKWNAQYIRKTRGADDFLHLEWNNLPCLKQKETSQWGTSLQSSWGPNGNNTSDNKRVVASFHVILISIQAHTKVTTKHKKFETRCTHTHTHTHTHCDTPSQWWWWLHPSLPNFGTHTYLMCMSQQQLTIFWAGRIGKKTLTTPKTWWCSKKVD